MKGTPMIDRSLFSRVKSGWRRNAGRGAAVFLTFLFLMITTPAAARADMIVPAVTMTGFSTYDIGVGDTSDYSLGYTFTTTRALTITALGTLDIGGDTIATASGPIPVKLYSSTDPASGTGTAVPGASVSVTSTDTILSLTGGVYTGGDGFRYVNLPSPIVLPAGSYELVSSTLGMRPQFAFNAIAPSEVAGMGAPSNAYNNDGNTTADYAPNNFALTVGGDYGPNFLVQVPEPSTAALLIFGPMLMIARRRRV